ncbi:MAG: methyltransferase domain-containing protein [Cyanobacteria bacterium HKST-UBA02]|nr:methyltransferase domain-containing protein [Cyanobacteria bacterium HKST-UBA02]
MPDLHYDDPRLARLYDLDSPWSIDRDFYLELAGSKPCRVLDLGCGTGLLCDAFAGRGHEVTGVDPSAAMLEVARTKPQASKIEWVEAVAQDFRSSKRFDLIIMTGHAFQVLLEDRDVQGALEVMRAHLAPGGIVAFESRNPAIDWRSRWDYEMDLIVDGSKVRESRRFLAMEGEFMTFELRYEFVRGVADTGTPEGDDEVLISNSKLRFLSRESIEVFLTEAGLLVQKLLGGWEIETFDAKTSEEMIFIAVSGLSGV